MATNIHLDLIDFGGKIEDVAPYARVLILTEIMVTNGEGKALQGNRALKHMLVAKLFLSRKRKQCKTLFKGQLAISKHRSHFTVMANICK